MTVSRVPYQRCGLCCSRPLLSMASDCCLPTPSSGLKRREGLPSGLDINFDHTHLGCVPSFSSTLHPLSFVAAGGAFGGARGSAAG
eukprot:90157-Chlamydomonas_euryale.AAC.2